MSPCAYVVSLLRPEIIRDLELHRYGFDAYVKDPQMFVPYRDGNYLFFRASTEKTIEGIRRLSPHDAEAYPEFLRFFDRASAILNPILLEEPPSIADLAARFQGEDEEIYRYLMFVTCMTCWRKKLAKFPRAKMPLKKGWRALSNRTV
jgi:phytoene dehydrogenase-like protein